MSVRLRSKEDKAQQEAERAEYARHPIRCAGCEGFLSFVQAKRGYRYCSQACSKPYVTAQRVGNVKPWRTNKTARWNGKEIPLKQANES